MLSDTKLSKLHCNKDSADFTLSLFVTVIPKYLKFTDFERNINYHYITVVSFIVVKRYIGAVSFLFSVVVQFFYFFF
jgi:hypothetical protein